MATRRIGRVVPIKVSLPEDIFFRLERLLTRQFSQKPDYGTRSHIITGLITRWLSEMEAEQLTKEPTE